MWVKHQRKRQYHLQKWENHKLGHFLNSGLGLRQLCDWAVFVKERLTPEIWEDLVPKLKDFGLLYFTGVMTRACIDALGLPEEVAPWAMQYDVSLAEDVIEKMLKEGNCGHKADKYGERLFSNPNASNRISSFFHIVASTSRQRWPVCNKYPILMPIAPFVLLGRYLKQYKNGERPKLNLKMKFDQAGANQKLYRELKPFITE
ncbi:MAG: nucleotidyltransferase family protein, partial [Lachnospiraceae bacterium]|nr:nucleotidyltransferase family protein [Lachnospiraceae bacterium]